MMQAVTSVRVVSSPVNAQSGAETRVLFPEPARHAGMKLEASIIALNGYNDLHQVAVVAANATNATNAAAAAAAAAAGSPAPHTSRTIAAQRDVTVASTIIFIAPRNHTQASA
jgi:hypothetical protein